MNQNGLHSIMVVKTAYRNHPIDMLNESQLAEVNGLHSKLKQDVKLQAVKLLDLKEK